MELGPATEVKCLKLDSMSTITDMRGVSWNPSSDACFFKEFYSKYPFLKIVTYLAIPDRRHKLNGHCLVLCSSVTLTCTSAVIPFVSDIEFDRTSYMAQKYFCGYL